MKPNVHLKVTGDIERSVPQSTADIAATFESAYSLVQRRLLERAAVAYNLPPNHVDYLRLLMDSTCLGGKCIRGLAVVRIVDGMTQGLSSTQRAQALNEAAVCGWMIEFMQGHFLIEDDIMDGAVTRRGQPCWYRRPGVTTACAINDGLIVLAWCTAMAYELLAPTEYAAEVVKLLHDCDYATTIGQHYDVTAMLDPSQWHPDRDLPKGFALSQFTMENYRRIVYHKTAYYTFHLPFLMGVTVATRWLARTVNTAPLRPLALAMGEYFQALDDYLDCFADPTVLGKVGTDIEDAKCSWLAVTFLERATPAQRAAFEAAYGRADPEAVTAVKRLYCDVGLEEAFQEYERAMLQKVNELLTEVSVTSPALGTMCKAVWQSIYQRKR